MNHEPLPSLGRKAEHFIWIYQHISPKACLEALGSHYGHDADALFEEIEKQIREERK